MRYDCARRWLLGGVIVSITAAGAMGAETASVPASTAKKYGTLEQWATAQAAAALDRAEKDGDFAAARASVLATFDTLIGYGTDKHLASYRDVAYAWRLLATLQRADNNVEWLRFFRKNPKLSRTLIFLIGPNTDPRGVLDVLGKLREKNEKQLESYATLAAAICLVHDKPLTRRINENRVTAPDPVAIFDYYVANEKTMYFGIKTVPAELLMWVVDTTTPVDQMAWALKRYAKDEAVGKHFFDIKYDYDHVRKDTPKKVTEKGYSLPNILQYGGVCADQAYFAMEIGKAIGVPTAYATGASAGSGHAWVGFLQSKGRLGWWNFDVGRYQEYKGVRGLVMDPQTRERIPDNYVSLLAEMIGTTDADRETAVAMTDAAGRLGFYLTKEKEFSPESPAGAFGDARKVVRAVKSDGVLELLEAGLRKNVGYGRGWLTVRELAREGKMSLDQKKKWSELVLKLCGQRYPDFALEVLEPMIATVSDVKEQDKLWLAAFAMFQPRLDLAAEVRMNQARMWEEHKDTAAAMTCYMDVINRYANAGPFVLPALAGAEKNLRESGKSDKVVALYADTWKKIIRPKEMAGPFMMQSNWYRVGTQLAAKLREAGDEKGAAGVNAALEGAVAAPK